MGSRGVSSFSARKIEKYSFAPKYMWKYLANRDKATEALKMAQDKLDKELYQTQEYKAWIQQKKVYDKAVEDYVAKKTTKRTPNNASKKADKIYKEQVIPKRKKLEKKYKISQLLDKKNKAEEAVQKNKPKK